MGNLNCKPSTIGDQTVRYGYQHSVAQSAKTLPPVLSEFKKLETDRLMPTHVSQTPQPRILSIACGYGEDVPLYRQAFGGQSHVEAIDINAKFAEVCAAERAEGADSRFSVCDARHLAFEPTFDLVMMRHPEPSSNQRIWMEIFVEAALFAQKSNAAMIITTFSQHELNYFMQLAGLMGGQGVSLVKTYTNQSIAPRVDSLGADYAHDRYVAFFKPSAPEVISESDIHCNACVT